MGALGNPKTWAPYMNTKDCTKGFCSLACPQWCYIIFTPPPPTHFVFPNEKSQTGPTFSPLVIAIIGILASAFLLVSYYAIISKYCGKPRSNNEHEQSQQPPNMNNHQDIEDNEGHDMHQPWLVTTPGLDEALIKAITLVKYHKGDGLVGSFDCSVCLGEFLEDDSLRLLPKCSHAFHVSCIDTWLKSHSNCPLCRANIISSFALPTPPPPPPTIELDHHDHNGNDVVNDEIISSDELGEMGMLENTSEKLPKCPFRALSDLGELGLRNSGGIDIKDDHGIIGSMVRRSFSMDHSCETRVSINEILRIDQRDNNEDNDQSLKEERGESSKKSSIVYDFNSNGVLQSVLSSVANKSFSSGRFLFSKHGRGSNAVIPL